MEYKDFVNERLEGMYSIIESSNSVVLEAFKEDKIRKELDMSKKGFLKYLEYVYGDEFDRREITNAKTLDERKAIVKKYEDDFVKWKKQENIKYTAVTGFIAAQAMRVSGFGGSLGLVLAAVFWGLAIFNKFGYSKDKNAKRREKWNNLDEDK